MSSREKSTDMEKGESSGSTSTGHKIESVPSILRSEKKEAYTPNVVSIGSLHRNTASLNEMENVKTEYMRLLFQRVGSSSIEADCVEAMLNLRETFSKYYPQLVVDEDFAKMMMTDGCFIVELLYRHYKKEDDPILKRLRYSAVRRDLLLLENQIPFSALQVLFSLTVKGLPDDNDDLSSLAEYVLWFFCDIIHIEYGMKSFLLNATRYSDDQTVRHPHHILHLLHICYIIESSGILIRRQRKGCLPSFDEMRTVYRHREHPGYQGTATQLNIAGAKLRKRKRSNGLFDVNFRTPFFLFFLEEW